MPEAKFAPPRKCPNCGLTGRKVIILPDWQSVKDSVGQNNDFDCPNCGKGFCGVCFVPNYTGAGDTWHCPHCLELLKIPVGISYKQGDLN